MKSVLVMFLLLFCVSTFENCIADSVEDISDPRNTEDEGVPDEEVDNSAREFQQFLEKKDVDFGAREKRVACSCSGWQCSCCQHIKIGSKFNENCCVAVRYLKKDYGIAFTLSVGSKTFSKEISGKNPPAICFAVPYTGRTIKVCVDFYDMSLSRTNFRGCVKLKIKVTILKHSFKLGCFNFNRRPKKSIVDSLYDRRGLIETGAESEAIQAEPRYQHLNGENQPLNDEDVVLADRSQEPPEESWQNDQ